MLHHEESQKKPLKASEPLLCEEISAVQLVHYRTTHVSYSSLNCDCLTRMVNIMEIVVNVFTR